MPQNMFCSGAPIVRPEFAHDGQKIRDNDGTPRKGHIPDGIDAAAFGRMCCIEPNQIVLAVRRNVCAYAFCKITMGVDEQQAIPPLDDVGANRAEQGRLAHAGSTSNERMRCERARYGEWNHEGGCPGGRLPTQLSTSARAAEGAATGPRERVPGAARCDRGLGEPRRREGGISCGVVRERNFASALLGR